MKRTALYLLAASFLLVGNAKQASACCYIPWLDPFAWLGFYGCGPNPWCGGGCGSGYAGYGMQYPQYGYARPAYTGYAPTYPTMNYQPIQAAPATRGCNCQGAALPQQQLSAVQVPVTTYRAVTQYVPQTTYRTQYQYQTPSVAYGQPTAPLAYGYQNSAVAQNTFPSAATYGYQGSTFPQQTVYNAAPVHGATSYDQNPIVNQPAAGYPTPSAPASPGFYQPRTFQAPMGDIAGDHEITPQAATIPVVPNSYSGKIPVRRATYGAAPQKARSFSSSVR